MFKKAIPSIIQKLLFMLILSLIFVPNTGLSAKQQDANTQGDIFEIPLEELMEVEIVSTATLTQTKPRLTPAAVTTITAEQIRSSGARSLYELLDIYVPNLQWSRQHWENDQLGLRGIISDRNDKFLLLVNGRNMNDRTHAGVLTELDQMLLTEIHHIDVVRGPGSALYGPGAVSMVINIITYNSDTFQGTEVTTRLGAIEEFYTTEIKHGRKFDSNDGGFFIYTGFGKYVGASKYAAPQIYPLTFPSTGGNPPSGLVPGDGYKAGEPFTDTLQGRDGADGTGALPLKLYAQLKKGNWDIWGRFERGGKQFQWSTDSIARTPFGFGDNVWFDRWRYTGYNHVRRPNFYEYMQTTVYIGYKQEITENLDIDYAASYQSTTNVQERESRYGQNYREDNYYAKILFKWQPTEQHKIAFGFEYLLNDLGLLGWNGLGYKAPKFGGSFMGNRTPFMNPNVQSQTGGWTTLMPTWKTEMYSFFGEWQWTISDKWTLFLGGRMDRHTFTDTMFSPRAALILTPNERDTYKLMWSRSLRANFEEFMKREDQLKSGKSAPEKLDSIEFRYERQHNKNLDLAASAYVHYNLQALGWSQADQSYAIAATQRTIGFELEASYHTDKTRLTVAHGYTKLYGFYLEPDQRAMFPAAPTQSITAEPYSRGQDLANWSNHNTKLVYQRKLDDKWTFDASMRIYWGFPGKKDFDRYYPYASTTAATRGDALIEDGWQRAYRGSYFLDLGLQYKPTKNLVIGVTGYNLLGIFNKDFNKRNYVETIGIGDFRCQAPAVGVSLTYKF
jgi:iron complex outermembrane receptor protein